MKRIVITGLGAITPAGIGPAALWDALQRGATRIGDISTFDASQCACKRAAEIKDAEGISFPGKRSLWTISRSILFGYAAAAGALEDAGLEGTPEMRSRTGVVFGSTLGGLTPLMRLDRQAVNEGPRFADPLLFPSAGPSAPGCQVSITAGLQAFNTTLSNGQTSGLDAIQYAARWIRCGRHQVVLAGAVEEISLDILRTCERARLLAGSRSTDTECRPFDRRRRGFLLGEGAAAVVLEDLDHALARNARIYAELTGYGFYFESRPSRRAHAASASMEAALLNAGRKPHEIGAVFASANGSVFGDHYEAEALSNVFRDVTLPVTAVKSILGESYSAAGAIQTAAAVLALNAGSIPGTYGFEQADPKMRAGRVTRTTEPAQLNTVLINAFGRNGNHASLIVNSYVN